MKKTTTLFIILVLMICVLESAMAEDFILRSGIQFGDSKESVLLKENTLKKDSPMYSDSKNDIGFSGTLSTISDSQITMYFGNDDKSKIPDSKAHFRGQIGTVSRSFRHIITGKRTLHHGVRNS